MIFLRELTAVQKAFCVLLTFGFVAVEIHSINKDRNEQERQHSHDLDTQRDQSQTFEKHLQNDFNQTVAHMERVFGETESVLNNVTGGDTYPVVLPQNNTGFYTLINGEKARAVPLVIQARGGYPLFDVSIKIVTGLATCDMAMINSLKKPQVVLGFVTNQDVKGMNFFLAPDPKTNGVLGYLLEITTRNGTFLEGLGIRKSKYSERWEYEINVDQLKPARRTLMDEGWSGKEAEEIDPAPPMSVPVPNSAFVFH